jgi:HEAT repeat protein
MTALPFALALAIAAGQAGGATAPPADPAALRGAVEQYLGTIDRPVSESTWRSLGPDAVPILEEIAASADVLPSRRARALDALGILGGDRAEATLLRFARDGGAPWPLRASAVRGAGRLLAPERTATELQPVLERDGDPRVRAAAAETLAARAGAAGCAAVRSQVAREPGRRSAYARALRSCGE